MVFAGRALPLLGLLTFASACSRDVSTVASASVAPTAPASADARDRIVNPSIRIGADGVVRLEDIALDETASLNSESRLERLMQLYEALHELKQVWKNLHPTEDFHGEAEIEVPPTTIGLVTKNLVGTAMFVGYRRVALRVAGRTDRFEVGVVAPSGIDIPTPPPPESDLHVTRSFDGLLVEWRRGDEIAPSPKRRLDTGAAADACKLWSEGPSPRSKRLVVHWANHTPASDLADTLAALVACEPRRDVLLDVH